MSLDDWRVVLATTIPAGRAVADEATAALNQAAFGLPGLTQDQAERLPGGSYHAVIARILDHLTEAGHDEARLMGADRTGVLMIRMPLPASTSSNTAVSLLSGSRMRNLNRVALTTC